MKENVRIAIFAAVNAYMQEEARRAPGAMPATFNPWKFYRLRELMRGRTSIQQRVRQ